MRQVTWPWLTSAQWQDPALTELSAHSSSSPPAGLAPLSWRRRMAQSHYQPPAISHMCGKYNHNIVISDHSALHWLHWLHCIEYNIYSAILTIERRDQSVGGDDWNYLAEQQEELGALWVLLWRSYYYWYSLYQPRSLLISPQLVRPGFLCWNQ